jgi:spectinomycin phosphotransferase/16S rRNA (guanine(1405)-N(7))-methyltransferase
VFQIHEFCSAAESGSEGDWGAMLMRPDLSDDALVAALAAAWGLGVREIAYVPEGFGSYHWRVDTDHGRRFVTVDDGRGRQLPRLVAALSAARALRDGGLKFVIAPEWTRARDIVHVIGGRHAVALYPFVSGETHAWGADRTAAERRAVLDLLAELHAAPRNGALVDDFEIPHRDVLVDVPAETWNTGPFGELARKVFAEHAERVGTRLARYEELVTVVGDAHRDVVTHGEPHQANTISTDDGVVLIDWDTLLVAPPERDLWSMAREDPQTIDDYVARTGVTPRVDALECYRLRWDLTEVALYLALFRAPHQENADTAKAWEGLNGSLAVLSTLRT